jgi:hypothetical protein
MQRLVSADNLLLATLWQRVLESAGIACEIRNRYIGGALGEIPVDQAWPQIWIQKDSDFAAAQALMSELQTTPNLASWRCSRCNESIEGQFFQCWRCAATRA